MTDIPKGYKQTEVGVIPEDWDAVIRKHVCFDNQEVRRLQLMATAMGAIALLLLQKRMRSEMVRI